DANNVRQATPWISHPDNVKKFFETGNNVSTHLAVYGHNDASDFRLSFTKSDEKGIVPNTEYNKKNLTFSASSKPFEQLTVAVTGNYINAKSDNIPAYGYSGNNVMQQFMWFGRQVNIEELKDYTKDDGTKYNWNYNYHNNPYFTLYENLNTLNRDRFFGAATAKYQIFDWLSVFARTGGDIYSNLNTDRRAIGDMDYPQGYYGEVASTFKEINSDYLIAFQKKLPYDIDLGVDFGGNRMDRYTQLNTATAPELAVPGVYNVQNSRVAITATNRYTQKRINSFYGLGQVSWKSALFLDITGRNDWSSTLPEENNSYFYPSVNFSAIVTDLIHLESDILSFAKLRGGWSKVGGDTDPYQLYPSLAFGDGWNADTRLLNQYVPNDLPNAKLKPQFVSSYEVGSDIRLFVNRVHLDITYYRSSAKDQIISVPISPSTGYTSMKINAGRIDNNGIEVFLTVSPLKSEDGFNWDLTLNFAKNNNKVVELAEDIERYELGGYWSMDVMAIPGEKYGCLYGYDFKRDPDGNIIFYDGLPAQGDLKILGSYMPDWTGGIYNEFGYKGISASVLVDIRQGGELYSMTTTWGRYAGVLEETLIGREGGIVGDGVKEVVDAQGNITYVTNDVVVSAEDFNKSCYVNDVAYPSVFDASFIKLREVKLGYTFKKINKLPFNNLNISVVGRNLAILKKSVPHIDPETAFSNTNVQGLEFGQLPSVRSFGFSISFNL
ncbi:MAG: TonB-dependent receptor, partial [Bacteroidia bacterium]|nr:TonB-dependent receptor [Bacteroidia bacterium]